MATQTGRVIAQGRPLGLPLRALKWGGIGLAIVAVLAFVVVLTMSLSGGSASSVDTVAQVADNSAAQPPPTLDKAESIAKSTAPATQPAPAPIITNANASLTASLEAPPIATNGTAQALTSPWPAFDRTNFDPRQTQPYNLEGVQPFVERTSVYRPWSGGKRARVATLEDRQKSADAGAAIAGIFFQAMGQELDFIGGSSHSSWLLKDVRYALTGPIAEVRTEVISPAVGEMPLGSIVAIVPTVVQVDGKIVTFPPFPAWLYVSGWVLWGKGWDAAQDRFLVLD